MSLLIALCVFLSLIVSSTCESTGVTITGISGCQRVSSTQTIDCGRPVTLTITGSGFLNGLQDEDWPSIYMTVSVLVPNTQTSYQCGISALNVSDSLLTCTIFDAGFGRMVMDTLLDLQYVNQLTNEQTILRYALSFKHENAPRVDRVSGCPIVSSDGRSVTQCSLVNDQITLHGSGFLSVDHSFGVVNLGSASRYIYLAYDNRLIVSYSDEQIVFTFGSTSQFVLGIDDEAGKALALTLRDGTRDNLWYTEPVYVTFASIPDPVIDHVTTASVMQGCNMDNSTGGIRFNDCTSGLSTLWVQGSYFFPPVSATVGGYPARVIPGNAASFFLYIPAIESISGMYYDLTVTTPAGSTTIPSMIQISNAPLIYEIVPCIDTGVDELVAAHCRPTETLQLKVLNVRQTTTPRIVFSLSYSPDQSIDCPNVQVVDRTTVTCVMPYMPVGWGQVTPSVAIHLEWPDQSKTADVVTYSLWEPFDAPRITSLSGCYSDSNNPLHLNQCLGETANGVLLTIHGVRLGPSSTGQPWVASIGYQECVRPVIMDNQTVVCLLPDLTASEDGWVQLAYGVKYPVVLQRFDTVYMKSNAGYVTFVQQETRSSSSSSSSSASTVALATVFSIFGAVLIAGCMFVMCRKARSKSRAASDMASEISSTGNHVELEEV